MGRVVACDVKGLVGGGGGWGCCDEGQFGTAEVALAADASAGQVGRRLLVRGGCCHGHRVLGSC